MPYDLNQSQFERCRPSDRPLVRGTRGMVAAGHHLAALAGSRILERGGNAVDAGVAAGICLGVLQTDLVNFGGVAPIMVYQSATRKVKTISGLGSWPKAASVEYFVENHGGKLPLGTQVSVIPSAPDAWVLALRRFGTLSFEDVSRDAVDYAEFGFPMHPFMANTIKEEQERFRRWPSNAEVYLPGGKPPEPGDVFVQRALADTLKRMVAAERRKRLSGRDAALQAARDEFYKGGIAEAILDFHRKNDGLFTREDLARYRSEVEDAPSVRYKAYEMFGCGPWCQGPTLLQALKMLEGFDVKALGHNSPAYIHTLTETFKLAMADRESYVADPKFVNVPMEGLLSEGYARARRECIDPNRATPEMPPAGDPWKFQSGGSAQGGGQRPERLSASGAGETGERWDTSYVAVMDRWGNAFSATPSDGPGNTPILPELGIICSGRGSQSRVDADHPASVAPGKRPRLTPNPALVLKEGRPWMAFGTPGGDVQIQAMLQVFLNIAEFGMDPQEAVESPRFSSYSFPSSFYPHAYSPGLLKGEQRLGDEVFDRLNALGHQAEPWADYTWRGGGVCAVVADGERGILEGAADPRRECYAIGW